jgi:hypothetical protein
VYQCGSRKPTADVSEKSLTFLELLASIGIINDIVVRKKMGGGEGDLEVVVKEEMVVVAKGKLPKTRLPRRSAIRR